MGKALACTAMTKSRITRCYLGLFGPNAGLYAGQSRPRVAPLVPARFPAAGKTILRAAMSARREGQLNREQA